MKHSFYAFFLALVIPFLSFAEESALQERYAVNIRKSEMEIEKEGSARSWNSFFPPIHYGSAEHRLAGISGLDNSIEIEDGSTWKIPYRARAIIARWKYESPIIITQNLSLFSLYNYKIVNPNTGDSIEANLFLGPFRDGPYTRYVIEIDTFRDTLILNDNTRWEVSSWDNLYLREWTIGDPVIIGYNSTWESRCTGLLINVSLNRHVRAQQF